MWQLLLPTALLLLVSAGTQAADLPKAVVLLDPQWDRVLQDDTVTLKCQGDYALGDSSTKWWHNGSFISNQASSFTIEAKVEDSGEYKCQTGLSALSDPVHLEVHVETTLHGETEDENSAEPGGKAKASLCPDIFPRLLLPSTLPALPLGGPYTALDPSDVGFGLTAIWGREPKDLRRGVHPGVAPPR
ncbi:hypothetical protein CB1_000087021 [Camelus ferus]|nr:hypothetical protein CB1_000087021 [Camelus ferus]